MYPLLQLGPVALQVSGLILLVCFWISLNMMEKEAKRLKQASEAIYGLAITALIGGVIGARLWYVVSYLDVYLTDPLGIIAFSAKTLDLTAGILLGILVGAIYGRWKKLPLRPTLDILSLGLAFMGIGLGLSHLASGNAFGSQTNLPWAIYLWDAHRHPTQIYEMLLAFMIFVTLRQIRLNNPFPGLLFLVWVVLATAARLFLEAFRGDSIIVAGNVRQAQILSLLILLIALWLMRQWAMMSDSQQELF